MVTSSSGLTSAQFDRYSVDLTSGALLRSGVRIPVQGQPFQVLRLLLEAEGKVVTREALRAALWPEDTFVDFELGVNTAVKKLRQALEDSADHPRFIETLPKYGYRFMVPVDWVNGNGGNGTIPVVARIPAPEPAHPIPRPPPVQRRWKSIAAVAVAAVVVVASLISLSDEHSYLSRTRVGALARRVVLGHSAITQPTITERRLTANPEDIPITSAAISPDGKYLAYTDKTGFYLKQVDTGETHPVPLPKGFEPLVESWFPDSIHMAVSWLDNPTKPPSLWEISVLGGTPKKLADDGTSARVSPDGSNIASARFSGREIWLMQGDGGSAHRIAGGTEEEARDSFSPVAWAPDGKRLAYARTRGHPTGTVVSTIEIADIGSGQIEIALSNLSLGGTLAWTYDNRLFYSVRELAPNQANFNLWWVQLDSQTPRPLGPGTRTSISSHWHCGGDALSVTKNGKLLALRRSDTQPDVYVAELDQGGTRLANPQRLTLDDRQDFPYSWTPDSKSVIFLSDRDGPAHIFMQAIGQTQPELLVGGDDDLAIPRLNPGGSAVLYLVTARTGDSSHVVRLMQAPLAGGPSKLVLQAPWIWNQQCARLPSTLCIYSPNETNQQRFFKFDSVTGASGEILAARIKDSTWGNWSLSPDGKYLATAKLGLKNEVAIRVFSIADSSERTIAVPGWVGNSGIDWAPDGKSLWVGAFRGISSFGSAESWALLKVDLDGTVTTLVDNGDVRLGYAIPSPDGRRLALGGAKADSSNVWLLENF